MAKHYVTREMRHTEAKPTPSEKSYRVRRGRCSRVYASRQTSINAIIRRVTRVRVRWHAVRGRDGNCACPTVACDSRRHDGGGGERNDWGNNDCHGVGAVVDVGDGKGVLADANVVNPRAVLSRGRGAPRHASVSVKRARRRGIEDARRTVSCRETTRRAAHCVASKTYPALTDVQLTPFEPTPPAMKTTDV